MRVLIADRLSPLAAEKLRAAGHEVVERTGLAGPDLVAALAGCRAILVRGATKVTGEVLRGAEDLRVAVRAGTGLDNIDVVTARERGVAVFNTPAANAVSVAEMTFGLLLALERHIVAAHEDLRAGRWEKVRFMGREIAGRTLGLVGFGRIGCEVAGRARAFGMRVIAHDALLPEWPSGFDWAERVSLDQVLERADVVSLHLPLTAETKNLIGERELALMKPGAVLVQCARGGIVDERALYAALAGNRLAGAALDVFAEEPPGPHPLLTLPNVIATPHLGASTREAQERAGVEAAEIAIEALGRLKD